MSIISFITNNLSTYIDFPRENHLSLINYSNKSYMEVLKIYINIFKIFYIFNQKQESENSSILISLYILKY